ncbi:hypothetical protein M422DRAFT_264202 [Sphaerobolus stellatus SS14]|uniref:DUF6534 domain-containing protein n=1 Tax=Sphaerobolus stellatus (strain SS14) TaxID=990650 RepID=A0A0C9V8H7_SPHS4|nr:hypothetical protein M422DRAFT_264202 [Sphaerobolus stellatus SS14]
MSTFVPPHGLSAALLVGGQSLLISLPILATANLAILPQLPRGSPVVEMFCGNLLDPEHFDIHRIRSNYLLLNNSLSSTPSLEFSHCVASTVGTAMGPYSTKDAFKSTQSVIIKLVLYSLNIGLVTTMGNIVTLVIWRRIPEEKYEWLIPYMWTPELYFNSLLVSLNARVSIRSGLQGNRNTLLRSTHIFDIDSNQDEQPQN